MAANARAAIGPDIGRVCAVQVKRETAARGGREGMRVQTLWNLLEVVLPVTAEAVADVTRAHAHTQPSQGAQHDTNMEKSNMFPRCNGHVTSRRAKTPTLDLVRLTNTD